MAPNLGYVESAGTGILGLIQLGIQIVMALAFLYFLYSVYEFIKADDATKKKEWKGRLGYSIVALFVMASAWGIVRILQNVTGATNTTTQQQTCPPGMFPQQVNINGKLVTVCR